MSHALKVSPSPYCCSRLELHSNSVLFIYYIQIGLVSREPSNIWVTQVQLSPTWSVGVFEQVWTSIWRLSGNRRRRKETKKKKKKRKFLQVKAEIVRCADSSPSLCEVFGAVCSLVISPRSQNGRGAESRAGWERHIINQECFYNKAQTPSNPTHSHTLVSHSSFSCTEPLCEKNALICRRHTPFFFVSRPNRNSFNIFPLSNLWEFLRY